MGLRRQKGGAEREWFECVGMGFSKTNQTPKNQTMMDKIKIETQHRRNNEQLVAPLQTL